MKEAVLIGFLTAVLLVILNFYVAKSIGKYYERGLKFKDLRMELLKEFVGFAK
jgi:hypothetical protein